MSVTWPTRFLEFLTWKMAGATRKGQVYEKSDAEYIRISFKEFKKSFDLNQLGFNNRTADSVNRNNVENAEYAAAEKPLTRWQKKSNHWQTRPPAPMFPVTAVCKLPGFASSRQSSGKRNCTPEIWHPAAWFCQEQREWKH